VVSERIPRWRAPSIAVVAKVCAWVLGGVVRVEMAEGRTEVW
jgi:hypothetical protein